MLAGLLAGWVVYELKKIKLPTALKTLGAIFLYPLLGTLIVGVLMVFVIGAPVAAAMAWLRVLSCKYGRYWQGSAWNDFRCDDSL